MSIEIRKDGQIVLTKGRTIRLGHFVTHKKKAKAGRTIAPRGKDPPEINVEITVHIWTKKDPNRVD